LRAAERTLPDVVGLHQVTGYGGPIMAARRSRSTAKKKTRAKRGSARKLTATKWSARVTTQSNALDLENKVFKGTPSQIAKSLKRSAERSRRRKSSPFRSAMSMLTFYINRAGKNLSASERKKLEAAKAKLREAFGKAA
jgi:ABC-type branched-subunit amino acid transport system ATPase component